MSVTLADQSILISANSQKIWPFIYDVSGWMRWDQTLTSIDGPKDLNVDDRVSMVFKTGQQMQFHVSEISPEKSLVFNSSLGPISLVFAYELKVENTQTQVTITVTAEGAGAEGLAGQMGPMFNKNLAQELQNLKNLVEKN